MQNLKKMAKSCVADILNDLKKDLLKSVEANDIMPYLWGENVISYSDVQNVESKVSHSEKSSKSFKNSEWPFSFETYDSVRIQIYTKIG